MLYVLEGETPLIKGMFINSHIRALRAKKGASGVRLLEERVGRPLVFKNLEDVPVREEIAIIEHTLDLLSDEPIAPEARSFEAGRLHFRNFITTPFGRILMSALPRTHEGLRQLMQRSGYIARRVFRHTNFRAQEHDDTVTITMDNSDYPIDHFKGLFYEWMKTWGIEEPSIEAREAAPRQYEYVLRM